MKIKYWMTKDPVTIGPDEALADAARLMKERGFHRLPVLKDGRLAGLLTERRIQAARPSPVSTLSRQEARYLASKIKVSDVMLKDPITVAPDDDALAALLEGHKKRLGAYPVLEDGRLVGIITSSDFFNMMIQMLGAGQRDDFVVLTADSLELEESSFIPRLLDLLTGRGLAVQGFMSFPCRGAGQTLAILLKVSPGRAAEAAGLLLEGGYRLLD